MLISISLGNKSILLFKTHDDILDKNRFSFANEIFDENIIEQEEDKIYISKFNKANLKTSKKSSSTEK